MQTVAANQASIQQYLSSLVTPAALRRMFGCSEMTLLDWRRNKGLPAYVIPGESRPAIRFDLKQVRQWAKANGKKLHLNA